MGNDTGSRVLESLPEELLREILIRLPCSKSATKCKVVSKRWLSIISSPSFSLLRLSPPSWLIIQPSSVGLSKGQLLYPQDTNGNYYDFSSRFLPPLLQSMMPSSYQGLPLKVIATCNDLILCQEDKKYYDLNNSMYICNPQTMQWLALPRHPDSYTYPSTGFACHPDYGYSVVLVNYDRFGGVENQFRLQAFIFSSYNGVWKKVVLVSRKAFGISCTWRSIFYDGMMFFYNNKNGMFGINPLITTVDEEGIDEQYDCVIDCEFIDWPPLEPTFSPRNGSIPEVTVCICQGKLRLARRDKGSLVSVWDFLDSGSSSGKWELKHKVFLPDFDPNANLFGFDPTDDATLYYCVYNEIFSLDLNTRKKRTVFTIPDESRTAGPMEKAYDVFSPFWLILQCWPTPVRNFKNATHPF